eukprot:m.691933 g.691933  ORF g.691933 m.691933 type:complete len:692 (+) comp22857_c0_seq3:159-2234(+)
MNPKGAIAKPGAYSKRFKQFESERLRSEIQSDDEASARAKQLRIEAKRRREKLDRQRQRREAQEAAAKEKVLLERKSRIKRHTEGFKSAVQEQRQKRAAEKKRKQTEELSAWARVLDTQRAVMGYDREALAPPNRDSKNSAISPSRPHGDVDLHKVQYHEHMLSQALEAIRGQESPNRQHNSPGQVAGSPTSQQRQQPTQMDENPPNTSQSGSRHTLDTITAGFTTGTSPVPSVDSLEGSSEGLGRNMDDVERDSFDDAVRTLTGNRHLIDDEGHAADPERHHMRRATDWMNRGRYTHHPDRSVDDAEDSHIFAPQSHPTHRTPDSGPIPTRSQAPHQHFPRDSPSAHHMHHAHEDERAPQHGVAPVHDRVQQAWESAPDGAQYANDDLPSARSRHYPSQLTSGYDITSGRTPTDDEINLLWDAMRKGLHQHRVGATAEGPGASDACEPARSRPRQRVQQYGTPNASSRTSTASSVSSHRTDTDLHGGSAVGGGMVIDQRSSPRHRPCPPSTTSSHASHAPGSRRGRPAETALARAKNVERMFLRSSGTPSSNGFSHQYPDESGDPATAHQHSTNKNSTPVSQIPRLKPTGGKDPRKSSCRTTSDLAREETELEDAIAALEIAGGRRGGTLSTTPSTLSTPTGKKPSRRRQVVVPAPTKLTMQEVEALRRSVHDTAAAVAAMKAANVTPMH